MIKSFCRYAAVAQPGQLDRVTQVLAIWQKKTPAPWNTSTHLDQMLLPATGTPQMWVGDSYKTDNTAVVKASLNPPVGAHVCPNGAYEGTACYGTVQSSPYDGCAYFGKVKTCHAFAAIQPSGNVIVGEGDSGGPVVIPTCTGTTITSVKVTGVITGGRPTTWPVINSPGGETSAPTPSPGPDRTRSSATATPLCSPGEPGAGVARRNLLRA